MTEPEVVNNNRKCPVCGSDTKRNSSDSPHDICKEEHTCVNQQCAVSVIFRN